MNCSPWATCRRLFASSAVLTVMDVFGKRRLNGARIFLVSFVNFPPTVTTIIAPGLLSKHELIHSLKSGFFGSTVGRMIVQSEGKRVGLSGTGAGR